MTMGLVLLVDGAMVLSSRSSSLFCLPQYVRSVLVVLVVVVDIGISWRDGERSPLSLSSTPTRWNCAWHSRIT